MPCAVHRNIFESPPPNISAIGIVALIIAVATRSYGHADHHSNNVKDGIMHRGMWYLSSTLSSSECFIVLCYTFALSSTKDIKLIG